MMKSSFVYLLCDVASNLYKIGVSRENPYKRISQLQTGNGNEIHLISYHKTEYPFKLEKHLHFVYGDKRKNGEWFKLDDDDVFKFEDNCLKYEEVIKSLADNPFFF